MTMVADFVTLSDNGKGHLREPRNIHSTLKESSGNPIFLKEIQDIFSALARSVVKGQRQRALKRRSAVNGGGQ